VAAARPVTACAHQRIVEDEPRPPAIGVAGKSARFCSRMQARGIPRAALPQQQHQFNRVIHERVVLLTVVTREQPRIASSKRLTVTPVCEGIVRVVVQFGFMEKPNITEILREAEARGVPYEPEQTTFFLSREELLRDSVPIYPRCGVERSCKWRGVHR